MAIPVQLAGNEHLLIQQPVTGWDAEAAAATVTLTASMRSTQLSSIPSVLAATSVALQMDRRVAMQLYRSLAS
jgi:hypothetical protein